MSTVNTASNGAPGADVGTSSISTPDISVSNTSFHGVTQVDINESQTSMNESEIILISGGNIHTDYSASFLGA